MKDRVIPLNTGEKFNRLEVITTEIRFDKHGYRVYYYNCRCDCGKMKTVYHWNLTRGLTQSCGCIQKERVRQCNKKYNIYDLSGEYGIGYTSNTNKTFYFDLDDYELIKDYCWKENPPKHNNTRGYITSTKKSISMHGIIIHKDNYRKEKYNNTFVIDHINGNTSDNRKQNLRICTNQENSMNCKLSSNNKSGHTGVMYDKKYNKWISKIMVDRKGIHLGRFDNLEDAIKARIDAELKYFGEYSPNYIKAKDNNSEKGE